MAVFVPLVEVTNGRNWIGSIFGSCHGSGTYHRSAYRSKYSKHTFTQAQLLVILCLMRYEDWTFRETKVRLAEHRELRQILELQRVPDYNTLNRFLQHLDEKLIDHALAEVVRRLQTALGPSRGPTTVAVDGRRRC